MRKKMAVFIFLILVLGAVNLNAATPTPNIGLDFIYKDLEGTEISLSDYRGKKAVLLVFWATWCPPCITEVPQIIELEEKYQDTLKILAINIGMDRLSTIKRFKKKYKTNYTIIFDKTQEITWKYKVRGVPHNILIDKNGNIIYSGYYIPTWIIKKSYQ